MRWFLTVLLHQKTALKYYEQGAPEGIGLKENTVVNEVQCQEKNNEYLRRQVKGAPVKEMDEATLSCRWCCIMNS